MTDSRPARAEPARAAEALVRVINETRALFHRLRVAAEQLHAADHLTAGERAVLVELATLGPRTVPEMAAARPVSRQRIQTLVDALLRRALVRLVANPRHLRSKLVELTREGKALTNAVVSREQQALAALGQALDPTELDQAAEMLGRVRELFAADPFRQSLDQLGQVSTRKTKRGRRHAG